MAKPTLLPDPSYLHLQLLDASEAVITLVMTTTSEEAECPLCYGRSARIHSRYVRAVADLPWMGCTVHLELHIRRFFCTNAEWVLAKKFAHRQRKLKRASNTRSVF